MTFKASAHHLSFNQLDDWIKLIRRKVRNGSKAVAAVKLIEFLTLRRGPIQTTDNIK